MELDLRVVDAAKHFFIENHREDFEQFLGGIIARIIDGKDRQEDVIARAAVSQENTARQTTIPTTAELLEDCLRIIKNIPWSCSHAANKERDNIVERLNGLLKSNGEKQPTA